MVCDLYRQLLAFRRHGGPVELAPEEAVALDRHLAGCPDCATIAARDAGWDAALRSAMTTVTVPDGLRDRIVASGLAKRTTALRRTVGKVAAAVVAVGVALPLSYGVYMRTRPTLDTQALAERSSQESEDPQATVRGFLDGEGLPPDLPMRFDYPRCQVKVGYAKVGDAKVPCVDFVAVRPNQVDSLRVLIVRRSQFRLQDLRAAGSSFATVTVHADAANGLAYVYVSGSPTLDPFLRPASDQH